MFAVSPCATHMAPRIATAAPMHMTTRAMRSPPSPMTAPTHSTDSAMTK
jgi:hypothetical protein